MGPDFLSFLGLFLFKMLVAFLAGTGLAVWVGRFSSWVDSKLSDYQSKLAAKGSRLGRWC